MISKQVIVPQLVALFPPTPKRVGDAWQIARTAAQCLVGEVPENDDYELNGTLIEVRKEGEGSTLTAVIGIEGQMNLSLGLSSLKAQLQFTFRPTPAAAPAPPPATTKGDADLPKARTQRDAGIVDAKGRITRVILRWAAVDLVPDTDGRLKQTGNYELNLARRLMPAANDAGGGQSGPLTVPDPIPATDESNSWVLYDDPHGRFHFLHPQTLILMPGMSGPDHLGLVDENPGVGKDVFDVHLAPGNADPEADRRFRDPQRFQRDIDADWSNKKVEVLHGTSGWLPEADWTPLKVYRKELGVKTAGANDGTSGVQRIFIDNYLVLASRNECFRVQSMTARNDHVVFRTEAEAMIKSFRFNSSDAKPKVNPPPPPPR